MILFDFSSAIHRAIHSSIKVTNPHKKDGKYITNEFIPITIFRILEEILENYKLYKNQYNEFIICIDNHNAPYWRCELYKPYKAQRKDEREKSEVNFTEVFKHLDLLLKVLDDFTPFKCLSVQGAEADDIISVLCKKYAKAENILILSPDKDFKQLHKLGNVKQYSALTNKWIENDENDEDIDWETIHCCLGDIADNVPRIVDFTQFTKEFQSFYQKDELTFYKESFENQEKIINDFKIHYEAINSNEIPDIFIKQRFGETSLKKKIKEFGSLDAFLDSNPIYRLNFERNKKLVLEEGVPPKIEAQIIKQYVEAPILFNIEQLTKYLNYYELKICIQWFKQLQNEMSKVVEMNKFNVNFNNINNFNY